LCVKISRQGEFVLWDPKQWNNLEYTKDYKQFHYIEYKDFWKLNSDAVKQQSN